jgi:hypothetical protein
MDINNIKLPAPVAEELYHSSLIETGKKQLDDISIKSEPAEPLAWKFLGNNDKKILALVRTEKAVHLPDDELTFLTGILSACKLTLADVAIINHNNHPEASYKELTSHFASRVVLLFDIDPAEFGLPMSFPHYQIQSFAGSSFLYSPSLKALENDKVEKSKLWVCLKRLFNL